MNVVEAIKKARSDWKQKVQYLMKTNGIDKRELSRLTGISMVTINTSISGDMCNPTMETMVRIAQALGADAVVGETTENQTPDNLER